MNKIKHIIVVGCGAVFEIYYARIIREMALSREIQLVTLCDRDVTRATRFAREIPSSNVVSDFRSIDPSLNAFIVILTPPRIRMDVLNHFDRPCTRFCCEKPLSDSQGSSAEMEAAVTRRKQWFSMLMVRRFMNAIGDLTCFVAQHQKIDVRWYEGGRFEWPIIDESVFLKGLGAKGGVIFDKGSHIFDILFSWDPSIGVTRATHNGNQLGVENRAEVRVAGTKIAANLKISWVEPYCNKVTLTSGTGSSMRWNLNAASPAELFDGAKWRAVRLLTLSESEAYCQAMRIQFRGCFFAACSNLPPPIGIVAGQKVISLCDSALNINS